MGAGASALPALLNEEELKAMCGDKYDETYFNALKNEDGLVYSTVLCRIAESSVEREVLHLYSAYCPKGGMTENIFISLCRDTKLLNKGLFSVQDAEKLYRKCKSEADDSSVRTISYKTWRYEIIPDIASRKGMEVEKLLLKLSQCDDAISNVKSRRDDHEVAKPEEFSTKVVEERDTLMDIKSHPVHCLANAFSDVHHNAVIKIQNAQRSKLAKKEVSRQKEIRKASLAKVPLVHCSMGEESETIFRNIFHEYCPRGEISEKVFKIILNDANCFDKKLTPYDAEFIFQKSKAMAAGKNSDYRHCVVHNKRLTYEAFRDLTIKEAALFKEVSVDKLINLVATNISNK